MTIDQTVNELINEKQKKTTSRFPCRVIMVRNIKDYCDLLDRLNLIPDIKYVSPEILFPSPDVMPQYQNLAKPEYASQWYVLTGVSEYLRLFSKNEAAKQRFAKLWSYQAPSGSTGRFIIPLWGCEAQWYDKSLHLMDDIRRDEHYKDCTDAEDSDQKLTITAFSDYFESVKELLTDRYDFVAYDLKSWITYWKAPSVEQTNIALITGRYASIQPISGNISVSVIKDSLDFIKENLLDSEVLNTDNCPMAARNCLFDYALQGGTLEHAILSCLNIAEFSALDVMGKWSMLSIGQKQLAILWIQLHSDNSYLYHCVAGAESIKEIEQRILHEVFKGRLNHSDWIEESQNLIKAMKIDKDDIYFKEINKIPEYKERLQFVTGICNTLTSLMNEYHRVIITGDHGTSRLAARFFHKRDGIPLGKGAKALSHGRYALITKDVGSISDSAFDILCSFFLLASSACS